MPPDAPLPPPPKPVMPASWQWTLRVTGLVTILLFLTPTFYVVKYFAADLPREKTLAQPGRMAWQDDPYNPDDLLAEADAAKTDPNPKDRVAAIQLMGETLRRAGVNWKRPMECLSAKATLADLAARDPDSQVRAAASKQLGLVAQGGVVIRR